MMCINIALWVETLLTYVTVSLTLIVENRSVCITSISQFYIAQKHILYSILFFCGATFNLFGLLMPNNLKFENYTINMLVIGHILNLQVNTHRNDW